MKPVILVSAINLRSGGTLSILQDCLAFLQKEMLDKYRVVALVHNRHLLKNIQGVEFIEFPRSIHSYLYRFYCEYYKFKRLSEQLKPYLWFSLHDMTPNVTADIRAVYCHNPSPFYNMTVKEMLMDPKFTLFNSFYKWIYKLNIKKNDYVVVQQNWLRVQFQELFKVNSVVVAYPNQINSLLKRTFTLENISEYHFCYPTMSRFFKNIEVLIDAVKILNEMQMNSFKVTVTIDGSENNYAKKIIDQAEGLPNINFVGHISREKVFELYEQSDCLIFPSKLETWGLPITEFKEFKKPLLVADLPYAHETVGNYDKVDFFDPNNPSQLAELMCAVMGNLHHYAGNSMLDVSEPFVQGWPELFGLLLNNEERG